MRNAAALLGIIAGLMGMFVGLFGYGWTSLVAENPDVGEVLFNFDSPGFVRFVSIAGPVLAIAGGAMARYRALWGGILLLVSAAAIYTTFANFIAIFPAAMCGLAGLLAITAGRPDKETSHF